MKKCKLLSLLLSVTLLFSLFSTTAFALDETITTVNAQEAKAEDITVDNLEDYESESIIFKELFEDIVNSSAEVDGLQIDASVTFSTNVSSEDIISSIRDDDVFTIEGKIVDGEEEYDIDEYYDFSSTSKYHIAEWAYSADLISEEEKVDCFCELILDRNFENIDCLEGVFDSIQQYQLNNELSVELAEKINEIFSVPFSNDNDGTTISTMSISNEATYSSTNFTIHYDSSKTTSAVAESVADYFEQIRTAYINLGFETPKIQWFKSTYQVYLDPDADPDGTAAATTTKSATLTNTCASYGIVS